MSKSAELQNITLYPNLYNVDRIKHCHLSQENISNLKIKGGNTGIFLN